MKVMVWCLLSDSGNIMTTFIFVMFVLVWLELTQNFIGYLNYLCGVSSAITVTYFQQTWWQSSSSRLKRYWHELVCRCPVPGCKEILVFSNKVLCNSCKREVCLKHRFGPDHNCDAYRKLTENNRSLSSFGSKFLNGFKERTSFGSGAQSKNVSKGSSSMQLGAFSGVLTGLQSAASSVRTSMETGMSRLSESTSDFFNKVQQNSGTETYHPPQQSRVQTSPMEECPQCQAKFATVAQLIQHVESFHASEPSGEVLDVCPKCGKGFQNPIILVNHVERDHGGKS